MAEQYFPLFVSGLVDEALHVQGLALDTDRAALMALTTFLDGEPSAPALLLHYAHELPGPEDAALLPVALTDPTRIDSHSLTQAIGRAILQRRHFQERDKLERPSYIGGVGSLAGGAIGSALTQNLRPLEVGAGLFVVATGILLYSLRYRDPTPPDLSDFAPPVIATPFHS